MSQISEKIKTRGFLRHGDLDQLLAELDEAEKRFKEIEKIGGGGDLVKAAEDAADAMTAIANGFGGTDGPAIKKLRAEIKKAKKKRLPFKRELEDQAFVSMRKEREACAHLAQTMPTPRGSSVTVQHAIAEAIRGRG